MSTKDVLMEIEQEVECHLQCETIEEVFDRVMQTAVSQYGEVLVGSVVEQLWSDYSLTVTTNIVRSNQPREGDISRPFLFAHIRSVWLEFPRVWSVRTNKQASTTANQFCLLRSKQNWLAVVLACMG